MSDYDDRLHGADWEVRPMTDLSVAAELVKCYHYAAGASNTATYLHGLFRKCDFWETSCKGVAWWIPPTRTAATATYPAN